MFLAALCVIFSFFPSFLSFNFQAVDNEVKNLLNLVAAGSSVICPAASSGDPSQTKAYDYTKCGFPQCLYDSAKSFHYDVHYYVYSKNNTDNYFELTFGAESNLERSPITNKSNTIFYMPGYLQNASKPFPQGFKNATLQYCAGDTVVVLVDYPKVVFSYELMVTLADNIAGRIAAALAELFNNGINPNQTSLIGFSAGAHIAASINAHLTTENKIKHLFNADPSGLYYEGKDISCRINKNRAKVVVSLHTSCILGSRDRDSTVDYTFYCNCQQPNTTNIPVEGDLMSHLLFFPIYEQIINGSKSFKVSRCPPGAACVSEKCTPTGFGFDSPENRGNLFVQFVDYNPTLGGSFPFCPMQ